MMPRALLGALLGSLFLHLLLLGSEGLPGVGWHMSAAPAPLQATLMPLPARPALPAPPAAQASRPKPAAQPQATPASSGGGAAERAPASAGDDASPAPTVPMDDAALPPMPTATPVLASHGTLRYDILTRGFSVGRAEIRWAFPGDGAYHLTSVTETSGLVALFKSVRVEHQSQGRLVAGGLQPSRFVSLKNGTETGENADFDWSTGEVRLLRDGSSHRLSPGAQDVLSLNFQLAYLGKITEGMTIGVVTGRKYAAYTLDSLGEEMLDTPLGPMRTLHLRVMTETVTEIWIALDRDRLPVKIRFTDKKGDVYEQLITEMGTDVIPPA